MFKNDRMMLILTGLVLAIFAGSMVQYSDRIMDLMGGETVVTSQDDSYSVRAGSSQILDVLSNDKVKGPLVVLTRPSCGSVALSGNNRLTFSSGAECSGQIEFAYCVDADGACAPNAVKINVISLNFAQDEPSTPNPVANTTSSTPVIQTAEGPAPTAEAPEIASFSVELAPPTLGAPSVSELISPNAAMASIRQAAGELNLAGPTDQNIATQNSAGIQQTASAGPSGFAAPGMGESSNISLGGTRRAVAAIAPTPTDLQSDSLGGSNITQLERGPEALASLPTAPLVPAPTEPAPLTASTVQSGFAPVVVASAQAPAAAPDATFSAEPVSSGPIALIALNPTQARDTAAGESLNIVLTEPGLQGFAAPVAPPSALAPASGQPQNVSILARAPNADERAPSLSAPLGTPALNLNISAADSRAITRGQVQRTTATMADAAIGNTGTQVVASQPSQAVAPSQFTRHDTVSRFISVSRARGSAGGIADVAGLGAPEAQAASKPSINLVPADGAPIVQASLLASPLSPTVTAPVQNSACDIVIGASEQSGAMIGLEILAICKPDQMVTISHSGLSYSVMTNAQGYVITQMPAMVRDATVEVRFADQSSASTDLTITALDTVVRIGVSWQASMDLDLNALEFGAATGSEGHIWAQAPSDFRTSRFKGGGYLLQLGDPGLERGALAEVYTLPVSRTQERGTVSMSLTLKDSTNICGQSVTAKTVRTREDGSAGIRNIRFTIPPCGTATSAFVIPSAVDDIRLAGR